MNDKIESILGVLEKLAGDYPMGSDQQQAIYYAASAIFFVETSRVIVEFEDFLAKYGPGLTEAQWNHLKMMRLVDDSGANRVDL